MRTNNVTKQTAFGILFLLCSFLKAQDSIPAVNADSTKIDTIVIRATHYKIKSIPRSANLTNPVISFNKTKPLNKPFNRFKVPSFWERENLIGLSLSEVAFVNWNAGGDNSVSALGKARIVRNYKFRYIQWMNEMELNFGWNAQEGRKWRKTDDAIRLSSTYGYRRDTLSNWYYSVKGNFNTQFADGFKYPDRTAPISRFMAPGYLFLGAGTSYISEGGNLNIYLSPLTHKSTYVLDQTLADKGAFGVGKATLDEDGNVVTEGENVFVELGFLLSNSWETSLGKNVSMNHKISLYTDYLRVFGNVDVDWELNFNLTVNEYINASIEAHMLYDDDIKFDEVVAADGTVIKPGRTRIQFRQVLGIGIAYSF